MTRIISIILFMFCTSLINAETIKISLNLETQERRVTSFSKECATGGECKIENKLFASGFDSNIVKILGDNRIKYIRRNVFFEMTSSDNNSIFSFVFFLKKDGSSVALSFGKTPDFKNIEIVRFYIGKVSDKDIVEKMIIAFIDELSIKIEGIER